MKRDSISFFSMAILLIINVSCESASSSPTAIPSIIIDCDISACNNTIIGQGFVALMKSNCPDPGESAFEPTASGNTILTCTGSGCSGTVTAWADPNGDPISEIASGNYQVCAYIDADGDTGEESGEPEHESTMLISGSTLLTLSDWDLVP